MCLSCGVYKWDGIEVKLTCDCSKELMRLYGMWSLGVLTSAEPASCMLTLS